MIGLENIIYIIIFEYLITIRKHRFYKLKGDSTNE